MTRDATFCEKGIASNITINGRHHGTTAAEINFTVSFL